MIKVNSQVLLHIIICLFFSSNKSKGWIIKAISTSTIYLHKFYIVVATTIISDLAWIIPILSIYLHIFITIVTIITAVLHPQMCNHRYSWHQKYTNSAPPELYTNSTPPETSLNNNDKDHRLKNEEPCHNLLTPQCWPQITSGSLPIAPPFQN